LVERHVERFACWWMIEKQSMDVVGGAYRRCDWVELVQMSVDVLVRKVVAH